MNETQEFNFATVGAVYDDGVTLIFDGAEEESKKHYKVNSSIVFTPGDRVKILADSGTYVVEYVVGNPLKAKSGIPTGGAEGQVLKKNSNSEGDVIWGDVREIPTGGDKYFVLGKNSDADGDVGWTNGIPVVIDSNNPARGIWLRYVNGTGFQIRGSATSSWYTIVTK